MESDMLRRDHLGRAGPAGLKRRLVRGAIGAAHWSRLDAWYARRLPDPSATILMYHSICRDSHVQWIAPRNRISLRQFERHMQFLKRERNVLPLNEFLEGLARGRRFPRGTVLLTFDDGYRDNLELAAPILEAHRLPAIFYLATGYVDRGENQWADELYVALRSRRRNSLRLSPGLEFDLRSRQGCDRAYRALSSRMIVAGCDARRTLLGQIREQLEPSDTSPRRTLSWNEAREIEGSQDNLRLGIHTSDHLDLTAMAPEAAVAEIRRSMRDFETHLGRPPEHFSFPYCRSSIELREQLSGLGLQSAMTTEGVVCSPTDPYGLPRVEAPHGLGLLGYWTSGAHPALSMRLFRRAWAEP